MPKEAKELKPLAISKITADGLYAVGGVSGLYLQIVGNSRSWLLRVNTGGKRQKIGLGSCKHVTLAEARDKARELHKKIKDGIDPVKEREAVKAHATLKAAKAKTFRDCAVEYIAANRSGWKNAKHAQQWTNTLTQYAFPIFGGLPVADIDTGLVLEVLQQPVDTPDGNKTLWNGKTETATRLRGRIESVLQWAKVRGLREGENPADWKLLKYTLPARNKVQKVEHFAALPYAEMGAFMADLRKRDGTGARALEFAILTALRSKPVRYATWDEIDLEARLWTIPAAHMKNEKEHRVPLSDTAIKLLEALPRYVENNLVFPAPMGGVMSDMTLTAVLRRMERDDLTVHGFRSTFRDWSGETTSYPREVIEHAMAHQIKDKAEAAYQRGDLLTKRAGLMEAWAHYCDTIPAVKGKNVVSMRAKASGG